MPQILGFAVSLVPTLTWVMLVISVPETQAGRLPTVGADQELKILDLGEEPEADGLVTGVGDLGAEVEDRLGVDEGLL